MNNMFKKLKQYGLRTFMRFAFGELKVILWNRYVYGSYSQSKEDLLIDEMTGHKKIGLYVDVGAFDPVRFNNTMRFYTRGWRGINIEPNTFRWQKFGEKRKGDINLNIGIAQSKGSLTYYDMDPATLSTFVKKQATEYEKQGFALLKTTKIPVFPLREIFEKYVKGEKMDFLSVDVEGFEMDVLKSNDWKRWRPKIICVEVETPGVRDQMVKNPVYAFLQKNGYQWMQTNHTNAFFRDTR